MDKPHHGRIKGGTKSACQGGLGYLIEGEFLDHPYIRGRGHTSHIIAHDEATGEVETRNSRYRLVSEGEPTRIKGWPWKGDLMRFTGTGGYDFQREAAQKAFDLNSVYEVDSIDVGDWSSTICFVGIPGHWNSVMFEAATPAQSSKGE